VGRRANPYLKPEGGPDAVHSSLKALVTSGDMSPDAVNYFLSGLVSPLVEPGALTFLWRGEAVSLELLRWIHAGVDRLVFQRLAGSDLWVLRVSVQDGGRFEYKLKVAFPGGEEWVLDPMNPHRADDPFGENSVAMTFGYAPQEWSRNRGAPDGLIEELARRSQPSSVEKGPRMRA
jgi:hypothetical protein